VRDGLEMRRSIGREAARLAATRGTAESHARVSSLPTPRWVADDEKDVGDVTNRGERRGGKLIVVFTPVCLRRDSPPRARTLARSGP